MKKIFSFIVILAMCLMVTSNLNAQFRAANFSTMSKAYLRENVSDGNKAMTRYSVRPDGTSKTFDVNGVYLNAYYGMRWIEGRHSFYTVSISSEAMPLYQSKELVELEDGRLVPRYRCPLSIEAALSYGRREFVAAAESEGDYPTYEGLLYLKWRAPLDKATDNRLSVNLMVGGGFVYGRYDKVIEEYYNFNNGFGVVLQSMLEVRVLPFPRSAFTLVARGGVTTLPGFYWSEFSKSLRGVCQVGISIPLAVNAR